MKRIEQEYYMIDEFKGAERVLIRSVTEINSAWIRLWREESEISCVHVYGAGYFLKRLQAQCISFSSRKSNPVDLSCRFLSDDCLEIRKPFSKKYVK